MCNTMKSNDILGIDRGAVEVRTLTREMRSRHEHADSFDCCRHQTCFFRDLASDCIDWCLPFFDAAGDNVDQPRIDTRRVPADAILLDEDKLVHLLRIVKQGRNHVAAMKNFPHQGPSRARGAVVL